MDSFPIFSETNHSNSNLGILGSFWDSIFFLYSVLCDTEHHSLEKPVKLPLGTWLSLETGYNFSMFPNEQEIFGDGTEEFVWQKARLLTLCFKAARECLVS